MSTPGTDPLDQTPPRSPLDTAGALYRTVWRWHFYAGLFVMPFVFVLALSGAVYLFKPQIEGWEERAFAAPRSTDLSPPTASMLPSGQIARAMAAFPAAQLHSYRLPAARADAALVHLSTPDGAMQDVFVSTDGRVLGSLAADTRITEIARRIHGQLFLGAGASKMVELAACWAIVMIITGLVLWWPRGRGPAGVLWPRRTTMLRDLHAVTGFWISSLAMVLLLTGLPWTEVWGNALRVVRAEMGWVKGAPLWSTGDNPSPVADATRAAAVTGTGAPTANGSAPAQPEHLTHDHAQMHAGHHASFDLQHIDAVIAQAARQSIAPPVLVIAPGVMRFGFASPDWVVTSGTQNRPLGMTITYDAATAAPRTREAFADQHPIDRVIGYGLAWHEGALLGAFNQAIGVLTAAGLVAMSVTGFMMWRRRKPAARLGAPALPSHSGRPVLLAAVIAGLALLLPLFALSLVVLLVLEWLLPRVSPALSNWLGITARRG